MSEVLGLFKTALRRRAYLLLAGLFLANAVLVTLTTRSANGFFQYKYALDSLGVILFWMLPMHLVLAAVVYFFFVETVSLENRAYDTRNTLYLLLSPVFVGFVWGYCLCQILSSSMAPYALPEVTKLSIISAMVSVSVFGIRRRMEKRHNFMIDPAPTGSSALVMSFCRIIPGAVKYSGFSVLCALLVGLSSDFAIRCFDISIVSVMSVAANLNYVSLSQVGIVRSILSIVQILVKTNLFLFSQSLVMGRYMLVVSKSFCAFGDLRSSYHCFLVFLIVYLMLSLAEESMHFVLFHPMKFSKLKAFIPGAEHRDLDATLLGDALMSVLPRKMPAAAMELLAPPSEPSIHRTPSRRDQQGQQNVRMSSEAVSQSAYRPHLWLKILMSQLDVADAMLGLVKPSAAGCPHVPTIVPSRNAGQRVSLFSGFEDAVMLLMQALATHDLSRSARGLYALDKVSAGDSSGGALSRQQRALLESELEALPLAAKDWSKMALSSCAVIDATALQFTLAAAFIEDQISDNSSILLIPGRMKETELLKNIAEVCFSHFPLPSFISNLLLGLKALLLSLIIRKKASTVLVPMGGSDDIHSCGLPKGVSMPVIVSQEPMAKKESDAADNGLNNRLKLGTFIAAQLIEKGKTARSSSWWGQISTVWYSYLLRNEISKPGILDLLLSVVIGQTRSRALLDAVKTYGIPVCPLPAVGIQNCVHVMEALTVIMGLELQNNKYTDVSSHIASTMTSLLGLQVAIKNHRNAFRRYTSKRSSFQSGTGSIAGSKGKEYISQGDGGVVVAQTPWVSGDIQALSMGLDDAFTRMICKYGDVIPSYSYPATYLEELKSRLVMCA